MLSRVADSIFWMSRYIERAENVARFVDVNLHLMLDLPGGMKEQWEPLVRITGDWEMFHERYGDATKDSVIQFLAFDLDNPNSIRASLSAARENARTVREIISSEMWSEINGFYLDVSNAASPSRAVEAPHEFFTRIKRSGHLVEGVTNATMSHGEAWHFCRVGRLLERADKTTRILDTKYFFLLPTTAEVGSPTDDLHWSAVLRSASGFEMYLKRYGRISPGAVAQFLICDREFPRSVRHCARHAAESLHSITGTPDGAFSNSAERSLGRLAAELDYTDSTDIVAAGLHEFLDALQLKLNRVGDAIIETFFSLKPVSQGQTQNQTGVSF
jgi:uncharacterized alpha-E superfamily protein